MPGRYASWGEAAAGPVLGVLNLFNGAAAPVCRAALYDLLVSCADAPAANVAAWSVNRTLTRGVEGSLFVPNNLDPAGPQGEYRAGVAHTENPGFSGAGDLLYLGIPQRATFRWTARRGREIRLPAVQDSGALVWTFTSTGAALHQVTMYHQE